MFAHLGNNSSHLDCGLNEARQSAKETSLPPIRRSAGTTMLPIKQLRELLTLGLAVAIPFNLLASTVAPGMKESDLLALKGSPASTLSAGAKSILRWPDLEVTVVEGIVTRVIVRDVQAEAKAAALRAESIAKAEREQAAKIAAADRGNLQIRAELTRREQGKKLWARSVIGQSAPSLAVQKWLTGAAPDTRGKFVLIEFWATWCPSCRDCIPMLNAIHNRLGDRVIVIGISDEAEAKVRQMQAPRTEYHIAIDRTAAMKTTLGVTGIPHAILVDPSGIVRWEGYPNQAQHELTPRVVEEVIAAYSAP